MTGGFLLMPAVMAACRRLLPGIALLVITSCTVAPQPTLTARGELELLWPPLPMESRIQWLRAVSDSEDVGITKGFWDRVKAFLVGEAPRGIIKPYGIFVDRSDRIFVADSAAGVVHLFDLRANRYLSIGGDRKVFMTPVGISGDGVDTVYITDSSAAAVFRYQVSAQRLTPFLAGALQRPTGIAYHPGNRLLYITDTTTHQVAAFDGDGRERLRIGGRGTAPGLFNYPTDLCIDARGELYVTDALNARIQAFSPDGNFLFHFGAPGDSIGYFEKPKGVALDSEGHIYVADAIHDTVQIFDRNGTLLLNFGTRGGEPGQFWMPSGLFIDSQDRIYVADSYNRRIQVFQYLKIAGGATGARPVPGGRP